MNNIKHLQIIIDEKVNFSIINECLNNKNLNEINIINTGEKKINEYELYEHLSFEKNNNQKINFIFDNILSRQDYYETFSFLKNITFHKRLRFIISETGHSSNEKVDNIKGFLKNIDRLGLYNHFHSAFFQLNPKNCNFADDMLYICEYLKIDSSLFTYSSYNYDKYKDDQKFHCSLFFNKLSKKYKNNLLLSDYYKNLANSFNESNFKNCLIKNNTKSINSNGNIIEYFNFFQKPTYKNKIVLNFNNKLKSVKNVVKQMAKLDNENILSSSNAINQKLKTSPEKWNNILITGWYGTETTGDKAILGEICYFLKLCSPTCQVYITSINKAISLQTNKEMDILKNARIISLNDSSKTKLIRKMDAVIIGGGPLMDSNKMIQIHKIFVEASKQSKERIIFGCGIGPLHNKTMIDITKNLLEISTAGFLRDKESYDYAMHLNPDNNLKLACCPSIGFISRWKSKNLVDANTIKKFRIATLIRNNTSEFKKSDDIDSINYSTSELLSKSLTNLSLQNDYQLQLLHMNSHWLGGDDREFNRMLSLKLSPNVDYKFYRGYINFNELLIKLNNSKSAIVMRYHGHIFCMTLGIPFISINYTGTKGKVNNLLSRIKYNQWSEVWGNISSEKITEKHNDLIQNYQYWSDHLLSESKVLLDMLHKTYNTTFNIDYNSLAKKED